MSRVDVFVPCYKYGHYLRGCVTSILTQVGVDVRVLILDDCSPDNTPEVAGQLVAEDPRVEYRRHAVNKGHIATYNEGIEWASGDYVLLLSADDLLTPGALGRAASVMDAHPEVGLVYGNAYETDAPDRIVHEDPAEWHATILDGTEFIRRCCRRGNNLVQTPTAVVRTSLQHRIGGYRADLPHTGDMEMWLRCAAHAAVASLDCHQAYYRKHPVNMSRAYYAGTGDLRQRRAVYEEMFRTYASSLAQKDEFLATALTAIARDAHDRAYDALAAGDVAAAREFVTFGRSIRGASQPWNRLRLKMMLGPRVTSAIGQLFRRTPAAPHSATS